TIWLSLGMVSSGLVQLLAIDEEVALMNRLGYPRYLLLLLGISKLFGVIAVLIPRFTMIKEWAYAGFFFIMAGAIFSHLAVGDPAIEFFGPTLLLVLTLTSWYFRPPTRKTL